jgi:hypothetical protein
VGAFVGIKLKLMRIRPQLDLLFIWLTKVLHILVANQLERAALALTALRTCAVALEDNDAVGDGSGNESGAVREASPAAGRVEGDVAQGVAEGGEQESHMSSKPSELEGLDESDEALLGRLARRGRGHC